MVREQATLPFVVPSHLSKLFGLKASVIVEGERAGGRDESERQRKRERGGAPGANSTCWGDGETAVTGEGVTHRSTFVLLLLLSLFMHFFTSSLFLQQILHLSALCSSSSSYLHPAANLLPQGYGGV